MIEPSIEGEAQKSALTDEHAIDLGNMFAGALDALLTAKTPQHQIDAARILVFAAKKSREFANFPPLAKIEDDLLTSSLIDFGTKLDESKQKGEVPSTSKTELITPSTPDEASSPPPSSPSSPRK